MRLEPAPPGTRMSDRTPVDGLPNTWRKQAKALREYGGESPAVAIESFAAQLEEALRDSQEATLNLAGAASESGYSTDHPGRLVREGKFPNAGRPGASRIIRLAGRSHLYPSYELSCTLSGSCADHSVACVPGSAVGQHPSWLDVLGRVRPDAGAACRGAARA